MKGWNQLISELKSNHLYPEPEIQNEVIQALRIYCPSLQKESRLKVVRDTISDQPYKADFIGNDYDYIVIKEKK